MITDVVNKNNSDVQSVLYFCQSCTTDFSEHMHLDTCPCCGTQDSHSMIKIYIDHDPEVDQMYTKLDWLAGD